MTSLLLLLVISYIICYARQKSTKIKLMMLEYERLKFDFKKITIILQDNIWVKFPVPKFKFDDGGEVQKRLVP